MRRADLGRRLGKTATHIENEIANGVSIKKVISNLEGEIGLKKGKNIYTSNKIIVPYKDNFFEGALKKADIIAFDKRLEDLGINNIITHSATAQVIYTFNTPDNTDGVEIRLVADSEFTDNQGKKHKAFPIIKQWQIEMDVDEEENAMATKEIAATRVQEQEIKEVYNKEPIKEKIEECDTKKEVEMMVNNETKTQILYDINTKNEVEMIDEKPSPVSNYKKNIARIVENLFSIRFFGTIASPELINHIINEIHEIYLVKYLEKVFNTIDTEEGIDIIEKIMKNL